MASVSLPPRRLTGPRLGAGLAIASGVLIAAIPFPFNLAIVAAAIGGIALLLVPSLMPILIVASVPIQSTGVIGLDGFGLTATRIATTAPLVIIGVQVLARRYELRFSRIALAYAAYIFAMVISLRNATDLGVGVAELYRWIVTLFSFLIALYGIRTRRELIALAGIMGVGVSVESIVGLTQSVLQLGPTSYAFESGVSRAFGTFGTPNTYGGYMELTVPLLLALAVWSARETASRLRSYRVARATGIEASRNPRRQLLLCGAIAVWFVLSGLLGLLGIALSFSRGAWLGIAAGMIAMLLLTGRRGRLAVLGAAAFLTVFLAAGGLNYTPAPIRDRFDQILDQVRIFDSRDVLVTNDNFAAVERMAHWQTGAAMFEANPLTGVGVGNFTTRFPDYYVNPSFAVSRGHAHNYYIHAAAETGVIGLAAYLALVVGGMWAAVRAARRSQDRLGRAVGIGAVGVTAALMTHNVVENLHVLNLGIQLSAIWAMAVISYRFLPADVDTSSAAA